MTRFLRLLSTAALLGAAAVASGCASAGARESKPELLKSADENFLAANYAQAEYQYEQYLNANPNSPAKATILLQIAKCRSGAGKYDGALISFERALAASPTPVLRLEILFRRAIVYNLKDDPERALADLGVLDRAPKEQREQAFSAPDFLKRIGITMIRTGDWAGGRRYLQRLVDEFPQSREAEEIKPYLSLRSFSVQVATAKDEPRAAEEVARLKAQGVAAPHSLPGTAGFLVVAGDFVRFADAVRERDALRKRGRSDAFVIP